MSSVQSGWGSTYNNPVGSATPWHDALLTSMANSGQTGQTDPMANNPMTSSTTTSAARMLGTATPPAPSDAMGNSGGMLAQSLSSAAPAASSGSTASSAGNYPTYNSMMASPSKLVAPGTHTTAGYGSAPLPAPAPAAAPAAPPSANSAYTVSQGTPLAGTTTPNANAGQTVLNGDGTMSTVAPTTTTGAIAPGAAGSEGYNQVGDWTNSASDAGLANIVSVRTQDGNYAYYQFNGQTGQYGYANTYDKNGNLVQTSIDQLRNQFGTGQATGYGPSTLTAAQRAGAVSGSLGGGVQIADNQAGSSNSLGSVNAAYSTGETAYRNAYNTHQTAAQAAQQQGQLSSDTSYILNYMIQNHGALPPVNQPGRTGVPMTQAAFDAAQQQYTANNSAQFANGQALKAPDTSAVDQNGLAALASLNSQYSTGANGADAAAQQAAGGNVFAQQGGQNLLAHNSDYAGKFNANLATYNDAVTKQAAADTNATGQKLNQDIQSMSDMLNQLQQSAGQLGTQSQQQVQAEILSLQKQISDYQTAAAQFGANTHHVAGIAMGILQAGGSLATAGVA